jgi:hypothetical protein
VTTKARWPVAVLSSALVAACAAVSGLSDYEIDDGVALEAGADPDGGRAEVGTGGPVDAADLADVVVDTGPVEDGSIGAPGIHCAESLHCAEDEICCRSAVAGSLCRKRGSPCPDGYGSLRCDDSFDCDAGLCCASLLGTLLIGSDCRSTCSTERFCVSDRECDLDAGQRCQGARPGLPPKTYTCR